MLRDPIVEMIVAHPLRSEVITEALPQTTPPSRGSLMEADTDRPGGVDATTPDA
jgi:hypothetical protein